MVAFRGRERRILPQRIKTLKLREMPSVTKSADWKEPVFHAEQLKLLGKGHEPPNPLLK